MDLTFLHGDDIMVYTIKGPYEGSIFGRLGRGIGQGINEQLPKEVENYRQANAIEALGQKKGTPLERAAELRRAGVPAHEINTYLPLAQNQLQREEYFKDETPTEQVENKDQKYLPGKTPISKSNEINKVNPETGFVSKEELESSRGNVKQEPGKAEIKKLAKERYANIYPYESPDQLEARAKADLQQDINAQNIGLENLTKDLNEKISLDLQGQGLGDFKDMPGEIQRELLEQARHMYLVQKMTPQQIGSRISDIALPLAMANNSLKEIGTMGAIDTKEKISKAKLLREDFEKYGFGRVFDKMASAQLKWSEPLVAHELDPLKNKKINDIFAKYPDKKFFSRMDATGRIPEKIKDSDVDSIIKNIKPGDNLFDIQYQLRKKGYNLNEFNKKILHAKKEKHLNLDDDQDKQIKSAVDSEWWPDILAEIFK